MFDYDDDIDVTREEFDDSREDADDDIESRLFEQSREEIVARLKKMRYKPTEANISELFRYFYEAIVVYDDETAWDSAEEEFCECRKKDPVEEIPPEVQERIDKRLQRRVYH